MKLYENVSKIVDNSNLKLTMDVRSSIIDSQCVVAAMYVMSSMMDSQCVVGAMYVISSMLDSQCWWRVAVNVYYLNVAYHQLGIINGPPSTRRALPPARRFKFESIIILWMLLFLFWNSHFIDQMKWSLFVGFKNNNLGIGKSLYSKKRRPMSKRTLQ